MPWRLALPPETRLLSSVTTTSSPPILSTIPTEVAAAVPGTLLMLSSPLDETNFIDYEYGGHNYRSFDIANHFCEFAGFDADYSLYPTREFQLQWLRHYLASYHECRTCFTAKSHSRWIAEDALEFDDVEMLCVDVNEFALVRSRIPCAVAHVRLGVSFLLGLVGPGPGELL